MKYDELLAEASHLGVGASLAASISSGAKAHTPLTASSSTATTAPIGREHPSCERIHASAAMTSARPAVQDASRQSTG